MFEPIISLGSIITTLGFIVTIVAFIWSMKGDARVLNVRLDNINKQMEEFRVDMKDMTKALADVAIQKKEIETLNNQITILTKWYDDLRRGEGWILPPTWTTVKNPTS